MANEGGINVDDTRPAFNLGPLAAPTQFHLNLSVRNSAGQTGTAAVLVKVVDPGGNSQVFHTTDATLLHLEMNGLEPILPGETGDIRTVPDLSGNGLDAVIVDPFGASFQVEGGAPHLASNEALAYTGGGSGPRGEVRDDGGAFEFGVDEDFSFEIYVRPADSDEPAWGDVAGTFRARVVEPVQFTERYGWGIIKAPEDGNHCFVLAKGIGQGGEFQVHSRWNKGEFNYVACVVERGAVQTTSMYVNGALVSRLMLDPSWTFETPVGFPAATFYLFTREQTPGEFHNCVPGTAIDAVRVQDVALSEETIAANWANICAGLGSDPPPPDEGVGPFRHGDCNQDGSTNLTDGIFLLNFLFLGGTEPGCPAACNNNGSGSLNITTAVFIFNFLFLGGPAPPDPRVDCGFSTAGGDVALGCPTPGATACP
jgi:hypothetical protein